MFLDMKSQDRGWSGCHRSDVCCIRLVELGLI